MWWWMLSRVIVMIILQYIQISNNVVHLKLMLSIISWKKKDFGIKLQFNYHLHTCLRLSFLLFLSPSFLIWRVEIVAMPSEILNCFPVSTVQSMTVFTYSKLSVSQSQSTFLGLSGNTDPSLLGNHFLKYTMYLHNSVPTVFFA